MARQTTVTSNAKAFVKNCDAIALAYHYGVLDSISTSIRLARSAAVSQYMNPRSAKPSFHYTYWTRKLKNGGTYTYRNKVYEKSDKLFIKSGRLSRIVNMPGTWERNKMGTESRFHGSGPDSKHVLAWVRPQRQGNTNSYAARFSITEAGDSKVKYRILHEKGGVMRRDVAPTTWGKAANWEDRKQFQVRARPFMGPALTAKFAGNVYGVELFKRLRQVEGMPL